MYHNTAIGIDIGGTKIRIGKVLDGKVLCETYLGTFANRSENEIIADLVQGIGDIMDNDVTGIGIGAPGLIDEKNGIVYHPHNIPSWKQTPLKDKIAAHFHLPVMISNDANCFALGEKIYGQGRNYQNLVGLSLGTGVGAGIIINNRLYSGTLSIAGEFGGIPYLQHDYEYYCSGQFFTHCYNHTGQEVYDRALSADPKAIKIFDEYGTHLGNLIKTLLLAIGPQAIILGGTVALSYRFFQKAMTDALNDFPHKKVSGKLDIMVSHSPNIAILGAAALVENGTQVN
jgi:glucokinase